MKNIKEWDWKKIGWRALQGLLCAIFNTPIYVLLAAFDYNTMETMSGQEVRVIQIQEWMTGWGFFGTLVAMIVGILLTIGFIKLLYRNHREDRQFKKQAKMEEDKNNKLVDSISKIMKGEK